MEDFKSYAKNSNNSNKNAKSDLDPNLVNLLNSLAGKYDGKSQNELMMAIFEQAKKGKREGTLSNKEIDEFAKMLSPFLDDSKRKMLYKIVNELKKI